MVFLLDCDHCRRPDCDGGYSGLRVQRQRRRTFYLDHPFGACRSNLADGLVLPQPFAALKLIEGSREMGVPDLLGAGCPFPSDPPTDSIGFILHLGALKAA